MQTLAQTPQNVQALTNALFTVATTMTERHPHDRKGIERGLALAQAGKVEIIHESLAYVASQSSEGIWYRLEGKRCSCAARVTRCAHRWAAALMALAQNAMERGRLEAQTQSLATTQYYATVQDEQGNVAEGIAYEGETSWLFCDSTRGATLAIPLSAIQLHGEVTLADTQRGADGQLWIRSCQPQYAALTA
jgi:hypothetical protein